MKPIRVVDATNKVFFGRTLHPTLVLGPRELDKTCNKRCAYYSLDLYSGDCNYTVGSFARFLRDLETPLTSTTQVFDTSAGRSPLYKTILHGKEHVCKDWKPFQVIPCLLCYFHSFCMFFAIFGWTTNADFLKFFDLWEGLIEGGLCIPFGWLHPRWYRYIFWEWIINLHKNDYPTIPLLMKSYVLKEKVATIMYMINGLFA